METEQQIQKPSNSRLNIPLFLGSNTIHILAEIIALCAIIAWISMKNKLLEKHIEDLAERLEEQEAIVEKHDITIRKLMTLFSSSRHANDTLSSNVTPSTVPANIPPVITQVHNVSDSKPIREAHTREAHSEKRHKETPIPEPPQLDLMAALMGSLLPSITGNLQLNEVDDSQPSIKELPEDLDMELKNELEELRQ